MKQDTRSMAQDAKGKMQKARESLTFLQTFLSETQPAICGDGETMRDAQTDKVLSQVAEPRADLSADMIRRVIARVECIA